MADSEQVISVVLVPKTKHLDDLYSLSGRVKESLFQLDTNHVPHVTIVQFQAPFSVVEDLRAAASELTGKVLTVELSGINFVSKENYTWAELTVLKTHELVRLQIDVLKLGFAEKYQILNGIGDKYRPHMTLGRISGSGSIPGMDITGLKNLTIGTIEAEVKIGINGEYLTFKE